MATRLLETHPLTKKLRVLEEFMMDQKISLEWNGHQMVFMDNVTGEEAYVKDNESGEACFDFPWLCETKLIREE